MFYENRQKKYLCRCDCGNERTTDSRHITRDSTCEKCKPIIQNNTHIGEKHGRLTCLGYQYTKNRHGLKVRCDCGRELNISCYSTFLKTSSCKSCSRGFFPGKRTGNATLLENLHNRYWKKLCDCGTIFIGGTRKKDCGCFVKKKIIEGALKKVGTKFHSLTVKSIASYKEGHVQLLIKCKCGNQFIRNNGHEFKSRSCGCELHVPVGEKASNATMKNCEVISIRELHNSGLYSLEQLANMFNKHRSYIRRIILRQVWKHI